MTTPRAVRLPQAVALGAVVALGALLRLRGLHDGLWFDEAVTWLAADAPFSHQLSYAAERWPHIFVLARLWRLMGEGGEAWLRLPFALYGIACVPVLYRAARAAVDERTALCAAALMALGAVPVAYSREARYYAPLMLHACCALWTLAEARRESLAGRAAPRWWVAFTLVQFLGVLIHPSSVGVLALSALGAAGRGAALYVSGERREAARWSKQAGAALFLLGAGLVAVPWSRYLIRTTLAQLTGGPTWAESFALSVPGSGLSLPARLAGFLLAGQEDAFAPLTAFCAVLLAWGAFASRRERGPLVFAVAWVALPVAALYVLSVRVPFVSRYLVFLVPVVMILVARGIVAALERAAPGLMPAERRLGLIVAAAVLSAPGLFHLERHPPSGWRDALAHAERAASPTDAIVVLPWGDRILALYYGLDRRRVVYALTAPDYTRLPYIERLLLGGLSGPRRLEEALEPHSKVWVVAPRHVGPGLEGEAARTFAGLESAYTRVGRAEFFAKNPVDVYSYERRAGRVAPARPDPPWGRAGGRPIWFFGNVSDLLERMTASQRGYGFTIEDAAPVLSTALLRLREGEAAVPSEAARERALFYVWSGSGTFKAGGARASFAPGDLLYADCRGECRATARRAGAVIVAIGLPGRPPQGAPRVLALARLRDAQPGCGDWRSAGPFEFLVQRTQAACWLDGPYDGASLVLRGELDEKARYASPLDDRYPDFLRHAEGDLYVMSLKAGDRLRTLPPTSASGPGGTLRLLIRRRASQGVGE